MGDAGTTGSDRAGEASVSSALAPAVRALERVRARARAMLLAQRAGLLLSAIVASIIALALADFVLRTPDWLRSGIWAAGAALIVWWFITRVLPAARFFPSITAVALRLEQAEPGRRAGLSDLLASGLELAEARGRGQPAGALEQQLAEPVIRRAAERFARVDPSSLLETRRLRRSAGALGLALVAAAVLVSISPPLAWTGVVRVLAPLAGAEWPKRTGVADATAAAVHPLGAPIALRAALTRSPGPAEQARVEAKYRLIIDGKPGPLRRALLTAQPKQIAVPAPDPERDGRRPVMGTLFERLIEPAGMSASPQAGEQGPAIELEYWFESADDRTARRRVLLVEPPSVQWARATVTPPTYAADAGAAGLEQDLGTGGDARALVGPVLEGSRATIEIGLSKPVPGPIGTEEDRLRWIRASLGESLAARAGGAEPTAAVEVDGAVWRVTLVVEGTVDLSVRAVDEFGIAGSEESVYRIESAPDAPPTASITEPMEDSTVLASAEVRVSGEGRDDVGLSWVSVEVQRAVRNPASPGGAPEPTGEWTELVRSPAGAGLQRQASATGVLAVASLGASAGDEVLVSALAQDNFMSNGEARAPVRSPVRRLRIIDEGAFVEQVWTELGALRRSAIRLDEEQQRLLEQPPGAEPAARRAQAQISDRLARERETIERLGDRLETNRLDDPQLAEVLDQAADLLDRAGRASARAGEAMQQQAGAMEAGDDPAADEAQQEAQEAQDEVRRQLEQLASLLDQGQDAWAVRRTVERLLQDQLEIERQTARASAQTTGLSPEQLTPEQRASLEEAAAAQRSLAERTAEALDQLSRQAERVRERDEVSAAGIDEAADRGRRERVEELQRAAAEQAQSNQGSRAQQSQQAAAATLEQMLRDLDDAARNRDEVLRRQLASLIDSIRGLIGRQESALTDLRRRRQAQEDLAGLDGPMATLARATLGVRDEASKGMRELARVAELLSDAASAQGRAVLALREADGETAEAQEVESLQNLGDALAEAERLDQQAQQRQAERERAELRAAYEAALAEQRAVQAESAPLIGQDLGRRERAEARRLAQRQEALRVSMEELRQKTEGLRDTIVFDYTHGRLDEEMAAGVQGLGESPVPRSTARRQASAVGLLESLVAALEPRQPGEEEFREQQQQAGGEGGQPQGGESPLVPPMAELRLLRDLQRLVAEDTRAIAEEPQGPETEEVARLGRRQEEVAQQGRRLLEELERQQQGGGGGAEIAPDLRPPTGPVPGPNPEPEPESGPNPGDSPRELQGGG